MTPWLRRQWNDIRGNVKYAAVLLISGLVVTGVVALTHGLSLWQQAVLAACFLLLFGWALFATTAASRHHLPEGRPDGSQDRIAELNQELFNTRAQLADARNELSRREALAKQAEEGSYRWAHEVSRSLESGRLLIGDISQPVSADANRFARAWIRDTAQTLQKLDGARSVLFDIEEQAEDKRRLQDESATLQWWQIQLRLRVLEQFLGITR